MIVDGTDKDDCQHVVFPLVVFEKTCGNIVIVTLFGVSLVII